jgi:hypothetical protein
MEPKVSLSSLQEPAKQSTTFHPASLEAILIFFSHPLQGFPTNL